MGRRSHGHKISNSIMGSMMEKMKPSLREQVKQIARAKGISAHLLVELYLERAIKEYQIKGF